MRYISVALNRYLLFLFLLVSSLNLFSQSIFSSSEDESTIVVSGQVYDAETQKTVPMVAISRKSTGTGVLSDYQGKFKIRVGKGDIIVIKSVGYYPLLTVISDSIANNPKNLKFKLEPESYKLDEVKVFNYRDYQQFLSEQKAKDVTAKEKKAPEKVARDTFHYKRYEPGFGVSFSLGMRSKADSEKRKEAKMKAEESKYTRYNNVMQVDKLSAITGLKGDRLDSFIIFFNTHYKFDPYDSEMEIVDKVKTALKEFIKENP